MLIHSVDFMLVSELVYPLIYTNQVENKVGDFLQENYYPGWLLVVGGVGPHQADDVEQGRELVRQLQVVTLLHLLKHPPQRLQVHAGGRRNPIGTKTWNVVQCRQKVVHKDLYTIILRKFQCC